MEEENDKESILHSVEAYGRPSFDDENIPTATSTAQKKVEFNVASLYVEKQEELPELKRSLHIDYLVNTLKNLPLSYEVMDCSRTWIVYWTLHSLALLNYDIDMATKDAVIQFLQSCQHSEGGFGGGPGQDPHLAPTYAAVNAICLIGTTEAYNMINRKGLLQFLKKMRVGDGSFYMHGDGEIDMRSIYCCAVVVNLLNLQDNELFNKSEEWVSRCQTYEGGFSGTPGMEAHGGYTFCGVCSLHLLGRLDKCDIKSLRRWILNRQTSLEGGFQGRTNKLVDSCYSFWQCGTLAVLNNRIFNGNISAGNGGEWHLDKVLLQEYLFTCCQHSNGGFIDKPTTLQDPYHTCYSLSGLSLMQAPDKGETDSVGTVENKLQDIHPLYNLPMQTYMKAHEYFKDIPLSLF